MQYLANQIIYTGAAVNGKGAAENESEVTAMNLMHMIPVNSISTMIAEDAGAPELRSPLAGVRKNGGKHQRGERRTDLSSPWDRIAGSFDRRYSAIK